MVYHGKNMIICFAVGHQSYTSPVFLIPKKGTNEKRIGTDFRLLNSRIQRINHPFLLLNETLRTMPGNSDGAILIEDE